MTTIAFFNNKGGVGKTTLVYHLAHMLVELGQRILMVDLDPQSNLTAMCLPEERLEALWSGDDAARQTVLGCVRPILRGVGDIREPHLEDLSAGLHLVAGDLGLSRFEDRLSDAWPRALDRDEASFRTLSSFHRLALQAADRCEAELILLDVGPNLGAINRAALLAADHVITPLAPDLFSMQGLRNLGPTLIEWRESWTDRLTRNPAPELELPRGTMNALGYLVMQAGMRLSRPVKAYDRWVRRMPGVYHEQLVREGQIPPSTERDPFCLGVMRHYQSLMPLAQDAQKPMFTLKPADGAIGAHSNAVARCRAEFQDVALAIQARLSEWEAQRADRPALAEP